MENALRTAIMEAIPEDGSTVNLNHAYRMAERVVQDEIKALAEEGKIELLPGFYMAVRRLP